MSAKLKSFWVPGSTFAIAILLSVLAGPTPSLLARKFRQQTGGDCCHELTIVKVPPMAAVNFAPPGDNPPIRIFLQTFANGEIIAIGEATNARVLVGPITRSGEYDIRKIKKDKENCTHLAKIGTSMEAQFKFNIPGTTKIPRGAGSAVAKIRPRIKTKLHVDGGILEAEASKEVNVELNKEQGIELEIGEKGPAIKAKFTVEAGHSDTDIKTTNFANSKDFNHFADFFTDSEMFMELAGFLDFTSASGQGRVSISPPRHEDIQEGIFMTFADLKEFDPELSSDPKTSIIYKPRCDAPKTFKVFEATAKTDEDLLNEIREAGKLK